MIVIDLTKLLSLSVAASVSSKTPDEMKALLVYKKRDRGSVTQIANKLGNPSPGPHEWLILTPKDKIPKPVVEFYPKPPKAPDGSLIYERIPNKESPVTVAGAPVAITAVAGAGGQNMGGNNAGVALDKPVPMVVSTCSTTSLKRRHTDNDVNGLDSEYEGERSIPSVDRVVDRVKWCANQHFIPFPGPPTKRPNKDPAPSHRPTQEQYQAMMAAAIAAGQILPKHHVSS